ncbi:26S proteasome non-ATPase regulatory subunit, partial [Coemansia guatemalensis]
LTRSLKFLQRGIAAAEAHYIYRALRAVPSLRKRLSPEVLAEAIAACTSETDAPNVRDCLRSMLALLKQGQKESQSAGACGPELCLFLGLLSLLSLLDSGDRAGGIKLAESLINIISGSQRRTLDPIASRVFFYYSRIFEMEGRLHDVRPALLGALQAATLAGMKETK